MDMLTVLLSLWYPLAESESLRGVLTGVQRGLLGSRRLTFECFCVCLCLQCLSTQCLVINAASKRECCIQAARTLLLTRWRETWASKLQKRYTVFVSVSLFLIHIYCWLSTATALTALCFFC